MKHIHTTATAIRKIKTLAKKIKAEREIQLAAALDLAAKESGFENFHHATHCHSNSESTTQFKGLGTLTFLIEENKSDWPMYDDRGNQKKSVQKYAGEFSAGSRWESLSDVTEELDAVTDEIGGGTGDMGDISKQNLKVLIKACKRLTLAEPAFIDGYAHWAGALVCLNQYKDCIDMAEPVLKAALKLIPPNFAGFVPYLYLENRPFHRLAHNLILAYYGAGMNDEAKDIAKRMLSWWPNDNVGFRFLLTPPDEEE